MTIKDITLQEKKKQFKGYGTKKYYEALNRISERAGITGKKKYFMFGGKSGNNNNKTGQ